MSIKQQGGIFGRNPTFNDVDVEGTLTVNGEPISDFGTMAQQDADAVAITGGSGAFDTFSADTNTLYVDAANNRVGMGTSSPAFELHLARNGAGIFVQSTNSQEPEVRLDNTIRSWTQYVDNSGTYNFRDRTGAKTVLQFTTAGNLAVANGNGIDFSATSGTGTSELFDDYEEGTWTAGINTGSGSVSLKSTHQTGRYTKIGRTVHVCGYLRVDTVSTPGGFGAITGLPYTISNNNASYVGGGLWVNGFTSFNGPPTYLGYTNTTNLSMRRINAGNASDDMGAYLKADSSIMFEITYTTEA